MIFWFFLGPPFKPPPPAVGLFYMAEIVSVKHLQPTAQDAIVERRQASQGVAAGRQQSEIRTGPATIVSVGLLIWVYWVMGVKEDAKRWISYVLGG